MRPPPAASWQQLRSCWNSARRPPMKDLMNTIQQAGNLTQWLHVQEQHGHELTPIQVSASINALQRLAARRPLSQLPPPVQAQLHARVAAAWQLLAPPRPPLSPRSLATVLSSLAKLQAPLTSAQTSAALAYLDAYFHDFKPIELVAALQGVVKGSGGHLDAAIRAGLGTKGSAESVDVDGAPQDRLGGAGEWRDALAHLPDLVVRTAQVISAELPRIGKGVPEKGGVTPQTAASFAWLCARTGVLPDACLRRMGDVLAGQLPQLKTVEVLNLAWACSKLGLRHEGLLRAVVDDVYGRVTTLTARDACQLSWALATLEVTAPGGYRLLAQHAASRMGDMLPQDSAMLLWALARAGVASDESTAVTNVSDHVLRHVGNYDIVQLSSVAWALAHAELDAPRFLAASTNRVMDLLVAAGPAEVLRGSSGAWVPDGGAGHVEALADVSRDGGQPGWSGVHAKPSPETPQTIGSMQQGVAAGDGFSLNAPWQRGADRNRGSSSASQHVQPQSLANILWACATSKYYSQPYFDALCAAVQPRAPHFAAQEVASTVWALSEARHYHPGVMNALADRFAVLCDAQFGVGGLDRVPGLQAVGGEVTAGGGIEDAPGDLTSGLAVAVGLREQGQISVDGGISHGHVSSRGREEWLRSRQASGGPAVGARAQARASSSVAVPAPSTSGQRQPGAASWQGDSDGQAGWGDFESAVPASGQQGATGATASSLGGAPSQRYPSSVASQTASTPTLRDLPAKSSGTIGTQSLANVLLAFARFDHRHQRLLDAASRAVAALQRDLGTQPQHACNTLLALAGLGKLSRDESLALVMRDVLKRLSSRELSFAQQSQVFQAEMLVRLDRWEEQQAAGEAASEGAQAVGGRPRERTQKPGVPSVGAAPKFRMSYDMDNAVVPAGMFYKGWKNWLRAAASPRRSPAQTKVAKALDEKLEISGVVVEKLTPCKLFSIDIVVPGRGGRQIAIEVDGETHYAANVPGLPMSNTVLRTRVLKAMGWAVVRVPESEWYSVLRGGNAYRYLMGKLTEVTEQPHPHRAGLTQ